MWEDSVLLEDLVSGLCFIRNSFSNLMTNQEAWFRAEPQAVCGKNDAQCYIYFHHLWWAVHVSQSLASSQVLSDSSQSSSHTKESLQLVLISEQSTDFRWAELPVPAFAGLLVLPWCGKGKKKRKNVGKSAAYDTESNPAISCTLRQSAALSIFGDGICMKGKPGLMDLDWCWDSFVLA